MKKDKSRTGVELLKKVVRESGEHVGGGENQYRSRASVSEGGTVEEG